VTHLRKMMLEELQRRNYSEGTTRYYIRTVEDFSRRFKRPPDRLGLRHIREYQAELFQKKNRRQGPLIFGFTVMPLTAPATVRTMSTYAIS
jgi:hypothetical protein